MIDTDKYKEGLEEWIMLGDADNLVPLLLAEVKRLREGIKAYLLRYLPEELEHHELKELIE